MREFIAELRSARTRPAAADPAFLTAHEASRAIAAGTLEPEALASAILARAARIEPAVRSYTCLDPLLALRRARELGKSPRASALHGLPVAVKDVIDTFDMPTQHNSPIWVDHRPAKDAAIVGVCRTLGALVLGKTDTHEFAAGGRLPATRNPHGIAHTAGGSSSGSAAAVAAGLATLAIGTQTGGSMLRPASFCGVFAIKPTFGVVSTEGAKRYSVSLDTIGWYGRSLADLALMAEAVRAVRRPLALNDSLAGRRFGLCRTPWWAEARPEARAAVEETGRRLEAAGAAVEEFALPEGFERLVEVQLTIMRGEGRAAFLDDYLRSPHLLAEDFRNRVEDADGIGNERLRDALDLAAACRPAFDRAVAGFDALVAPGAVGEAPRSLATTGDPLFQRAWSALHVPCVALPGFTGPTGMPVGVQLVAARYRDAELLEVAAACAAAIGAPAVDPVSPAREGEAGAR